MSLSGALPAGLLKRERTFALTDYDGMTLLGVTDTARGPLRGLVGNTPPAPGLALTGFLDAVKFRAEILSFVGKRQSCRQEIAISGAGGSALPRAGSACSRDTANRISGIVGKFPMRPLGGVVLPVDASNSSACYFVSGISPHRTLL